MLADFMTIKENFGHLEGINLTYVGDGRNNMAFINGGRRNAWR